MISKYYIYFSVALRGRVIQRGTLFLHWGFLLSRTALQQVLETGATDVLFHHANHWGLNEHIFRLRANLCRAPNGRRVAGRDIHSFPALLVLGNRVEKKSGDRKAQQHKAIEVEMVPKKGLYHGYSKRGWEWGWGGLSYRPGVTYWVRRRIKRRGDLCGQAGGFFCRHDFVCVSRVGGAVWSVVLLSSYILQDPASFFLESGIQDEDSGAVALSVCKDCWSVTGLCHSLIELDCGSLLLFKPRRVPKRPLW